MHVTSFSAVDVNSRATGDQDFSFASGRLARCQVCAKTSKNDRASYSNARYRGSVIKSEV